MRKRIVRVKVYFYFEGSVIGVSAPSPEAAGALVVPIIIPLFVFAGFFINSR